MAMSQAWRGPTSPFPFISGVNYRFTPKHSLPMPEKNVLHRKRFPPHLKAATLQNRQLRGQTCGSLGCGRGAEQGEYGLVMGAGVSWQYPTRGWLGARSCVSFLPLRDKGLLGGERLWPDPRCPEPPSDFLGLDLG